MPRNQHVDTTCVFEEPKKKPDLPLTVFYNLKNFERIDSNKNDFRKLYLSPHIN